MWILHFFMKKKNNNEKEISEEDKFFILKFWEKDYPEHFGYCPENLKKKYTENQIIKLAFHYQILGNEEDSQVLAKIKEDMQSLELKFEKKKEKSLKGLVWKKLKEHLAEIIVVLFLILIIALIKIF